MRRNKFYLLTTPVLFVVFFPLFLAWYGLRELPELWSEFCSLPGGLRKAWEISTWF